MAEATKEVPASETSAIRLARDLVNKLGIIAQFRGVSVNEIVSPLLRDPVEAAYREVVAEMASELAAPTP